jgi:hypothetical protein
MQHGMRSNCLKNFVATNFRDSEKVGKTEWIQRTSSIVRLNLIISEAVDANSAAFGAITW